MITPYIRTSTDRAAGSHTSDTRSQAQTATSRIDLRYQLASLATDLQWSLVHAGIFLKCAQISDQNSNTRVFSPWRHLLADNSAVSMLCLSYSDRIGVPDHVTRTALEFLRMLAATKNSTQQTIATSFGAAAKRDGSTARLLLSWRAVVKLGLDLLHAMHRQSQPWLPEIYLNNGMIIERWIEAIYSQTDRGQEVLLPALVQRRSSPRASTNVRCTLTVDGRTVAATVIDASTGGVGILCDEQLIEGQQVTLELSDGRRLSGTAIWSFGGRSGLQLDQSLDSHQVQALRQVSLN